MRRRRREKKEKRKEEEERSCGSLSSGELTPFSWNVDRFLIEPSVKVAASDGVWRVLRSGHFRSVLGNCLCLGFYRLCGPLWSCRLHGPLCVCRLHGPLCFYWLLVWLLIFTGTPLLMSLPAANNNFMKHVVQLCLKTEQRHNNNSDTGSVQFGLVFKWTTGSVKSRKVRVCVEHVQ